MEWRGLSKRERMLITVLTVMFVLMVLSRQPEWVGVDLAIALAWVAFFLFFVMLGIVVFVPDDTMAQLTAQSNKQAAKNAQERIQARRPKPPHREGYNDGLD